MNKKLTARVCVALGVIVVGGAVLAGSAGVFSPTAEGNPGQGTGQATTSPEAGLDPIKVAWNNQVAADQAHAAEVWADPEKRAEALAAKEAAKAEGLAVTGKAHQQQDIRAMCNVGPIDKSPPVSTMGFLRNSPGLIAVIQGKCLYVWAGQPGSDNASDGAVFVIILTVDNTMWSNMWTFPGTGPLTLTKLTDGGIATLAPVEGKPFILNVTKS